MQLPTSHSRTLPTCESRACPPKTESDAQQALIRLLGSAPLPCLYPVCTPRTERQTEGWGVHTPAAGLSFLACPAPDTQTGVQTSCCWRVLVLALSCTSCISLASFLLVFTSLCVVFPRLFLCFLPREAAHHYTGPSPERSSPRSLLGLRAPVRLLFVWV